VDEALHLCPSGGHRRVGRVTIDGYLAKVRVDLSPGRMAGLYPTRHMAVSASADRTPSVAPPSEKAIWLHGITASPGNAPQSVTGDLYCISQLGGMGANGGTFAWLIGPSATPPA